MIGLNGEMQFSGRYEENFIEHRRAQLQEFINYMCRHPVLSSCEVWIHFLTCTDEKQWKQGRLIKLFNKKKTHFLYALLS